MLKRPDPPSPDTQPAILPAAITQVKAVIGRKKVRRPILVDGTRPKVWERVDGESTDQYLAFCQYRDMNYDVRSIKAVMEAGGSGLCYKWASLHNWKTRAAAYDDWMEKRLRAKVERKKIEMRDRQSRLGRRMQDIALDALGVDPTTGEFNGGENMVMPESIGEVVKLADVGTRIERMALQENVGVAQGGIIFQYNGPLPSWAAPVAGELPEGSGDKDKIIEAEAEFTDDDEEDADEKKEVEDDGEDDGA